MASAPPDDGGGDLSGSEDYSTSGTESDNDAGVGEEEPAPKKRVTTKSKGAATYKTKFNKEWSKKWPFIKDVKGNPHQFLCTICNRQINCSHMGQRDVERHIEKDMHTKNVKATRHQSTLNFLPKSDSIMTKVTRAEVKVATMLVKNNIPLALADEMTPLFRDIFTDSEIAKNFSCRRTKTACIINGAIAPHFQQRLVDAIKTAPFAVAIDGSSDTGVEKMNPLTIRFFDTARQQICTQFLDMCMSSTSTAEGIFSKMDEALMKHGISWQNCVGIGVDNTSVNLGRRNSIKTRILQKNSQTYVMGCPCHIVHNTAVKASTAFEQESSFSIEDVIIDLYYWFDKSTKRKTSLVEYCSFCDLDYREIVKHVNTRWLSLERAISRVLQQYEALKSYFLSTDDSAPRFQRLHAAFGCPMTEIYLLFYQSALQTFVNFNKFLQREDPLLPIMVDQMVSFLRKLSSKFLKPVAIRALTEDFSALDYKELENQQEDDGLFVGIGTKMLLKKLLDNGDIDPRSEKKFYRSARMFYMQAMAYSLSNLPLKDDLLINASFVNFKKRADVKFSQVEYFVLRFNDLLPFNMPEQLDRLLEEFTEYQLLAESDIPQSTWQKAAVQEKQDGTIYHRLDVLWHYLSTMEDPDSQKRFARLSRVAMLVLVIPHSNAEEERVFSMVRKNKTSFRPSLDPKGTLSSVLTIKLADPGPAHQYEPSATVLKKAKSSTWEYNKAHSSSTMQ